MHHKTLRIATRQSLLALWQANNVKQQLETLFPDVCVELVKITTTGDKFLQGPLSQVGGKGLFVKELEMALLANEADIAVHSMKDVPAEFPEGLMLAAICEREDPRDAFISNNYKSLHELPSGSVIGTASLRRECLLHRINPQWQVKLLRGNVDSRLKKLDDGDYDAIILATAGLVRLNQQHRIREYLDVDRFIPAAGQGAMGIECREDDGAVREMLDRLNHAATATCVGAERAMTSVFDGGCQVPMAAFATLDDKRISLRGMVGKPDGSQVLVAESSGVIDQAENIGEQVAEKLIQQGAQQILQELKTHAP